MELAGFDYHFYVYGLNDQFKYDLLSLILNGSSFLLSLQLVVSASALNSKIEVSPLV